MTKPNKAELQVVGKTGGPHRSGQPAVTSAPDEPGFGVYVHWPFCQSKCPYCDFNSHVRHASKDAGKGGGVDETRFLKAYIRELKYLATEMPDEKVRSIFFGGGTPSLMAPKTVETILGAISSHWAFEDDVEITLEANPTSVEAERFKGYAKAGVNRVSLGVQALNDPDLKALGRLHDVDEAMRALDIAEANFDRFSFDLIYARPHQTLNDWEQELSRALERGADHTSLYQLTIEPETPFWALHKAGKLQIPEPALADDFYQLTQAICENSGFGMYEISNHAKAGQECRHNLIYWQYGRYIGIGAGAHGRISVDGAHLATSTERHPETWLQLVEQDGHGIIEREAIDHRGQADEMLLMGVRLSNGLNLERMKSMTGYSVDKSKLKDLIDDDLIHFSDDTSHLRASTKGRMVLNELVLQVSESLQLD